MFCGLIHVFIHQWRQGKKKGKNGKKRKSIYEHTDKDNTMQKVT